MEEQEAKVRHVAILDKNNMVIQVMTWPVDIPKQRILDEFYSDLYYVLEYDPENTVTAAGISCFYDSELNGFVSRKPLDQPTYVFNKKTLRWEPDPNLEYDILGDGNIVKWDPIEQIFYSVDTTES